MRRSEMSRRVAGAAGAIALIAGLTACGGGSDAGDAPTLTFWMYQPRTPQAGQIYEDLRKGFEKANNVKVKYVQIAKDDYNTKLSSAIASGTAPDAGVLDQPLVSRFALDKTIVAVPDG